MAATINIQKSVYKTISMKMDPGEEVMEVAQALSVQFENCLVTVDLFARTRRSYINGEIAGNVPDLTTFYTNPSSDDVWEWTMLGQVKD